jgi:hypothetical protein
MSTRHSQVGLQMLLDRRSHDDSTQIYLDAVRSDRADRSRASFELRTARQHETATIHRLARSHAEVSDRALDVRRQRLHHLLMSDEVRYSAEVASSAETPPSAVGMPSVIRIVECAHA